MFVIATAAVIIGPFPNEDDAIAYAKFHLSPVITWSVRPIVKPT